MILKIQRYDNNQKWWYIDNIRKVSVSEPYKRRPGSFEYIDLVIEDIESDCTCASNQEGCSECVDCLLLICRLDDGSEYSIQFDTLAYLLNDQGKTIEKIVANYNVCTNREECDNIKSS